MLAQDFDFDLSELCGDAPRHRAQGGGGVLVVDDDPAIVELLVALLHDDERFAVRTAYSAEQAAALAPVQPPALILLDVSLPGESVTSAAALLRSRRGWEDAHIVVCSGKEDLDIIARDLGADGYLRKPFNLDAVVEVVERYARRER